MENNMEQRIEEQLDGLTKNEIVELNLDNCKVPQIEGLTEEFKNLACLSLINCGLTTLKGLPNLPELRRLELSDNKLSGTLNLLTSACPKLTHLHLGGNKIKEIDALEPLKELAGLRNVDLFNCEVTEVDGYRGKVFELLPQISYLDGTNANDEEDTADDDDDEENEENEEEEDASEGDGENDDEEDEVGLSYLQKSGLEEESDGEDFQPNGTNDDDDDEDDDDEDEEDMEGEVNGEEEKDSPAVPRGRGIKRKRAAEDDGATADSKTPATTNNEAETEEKSNGE